MNPPKQTKTTGCPICGKRVKVAQHPSPAWRSMAEHADRDGEHCPGSGRSRAEAKQFGARG